MFLHFFGAKSMVQNLNKINKYLNKAESRVKLIFKNSRKTIKLINNQVVAACQ